MIVNDSDAVAVFEAESVTVTLVVEVPVVVGVPVMAPFVDRTRPVGSDEPLDTAHVYPVPDPPVEARTCE